MGTCYGLQHLMRALSNQEGGFDLPLPPFTQTYTIEKKTHTHTHPQAQPLSIAVCYKVYTCESRPSRQKLLKETIHVGLHPNNINRDSATGIPEVWEPGS